jgi:hypothetical protein
MNLGYFWYNLSKETYFHLNSFIENSGHPHFFLLDEIQGKEIVEEEENLCRYDNKTYTYSPITDLKINEINMRSTITDLDSFVQTEFDFDFLKNTFDGNKLKLHCIDAIIHRQSEYHFGEKFKASFNEACSVSPFSGTVKYPYCFSETFIYMTDLTDGSRESMIKKMAMRLRVDKIMERRSKYEKRGFQIKLNEAKQFIKEIHPKSKKRYLEDILDEKVPHKKICLQSGSQDLIDPFCQKWSDYR